MPKEQLITMSREYGADARYVLAGGGNTSWKDEGVMWVKKSGAPLSDIDEEGFVALDCAALLAVLQKEYADDDAAREAAVLQDIMASRLDGQQGKRPSVECVLHALFPYAYVLHVHPALVNGLTCGRDGARQCAALFGDEVLWVPLTKPGYVLSKLCSEQFRSYERDKGCFPKVVLLQNHGVFVAAESVQEIDQLAAEVMDKLGRMQDRQPDFTPVAAPETTVRILTALRMLYGDEDNLASGRYFANGEILRYAQSAASMTPLMHPYSPDQIVYCKAAPLYIEERDLVDNVDGFQHKFAEFTHQNGYKPRIVVVKDVGAFALGASAKEAETARQVFLDAVAVTVYTRPFGGPLCLPDDFTSFILSWEAESYRQSVLQQGGPPKRMLGRICIVTGAAQGFGEGIARALAAQGGYVAVADLNAKAAQSVSDSINRQLGAQTTIAIATDVTDEQSVRDMVERTTLTYGGLDVLISCAGVLFAGDVATLTKKQFDMVTQVNYTGYFLCVKYAAQMMKYQRAFAPRHTADIVEINSKSGLEGSKKNFAYAGSKFGGVGLTQSFALELVEFGVKVNAICPGNFLDGPLWSDPEKGLFRQYLDTGKAPGAKTIEDVRRFYEAKVPMGRGCTIEDVVRAILYVIEQQYETGQALPVTGGQVMLN